MPARKSRGLGNILEDNGACFHKAAGSNRTVLAIEIRFLWPSIGHPARGLRLRVLLLLLCCRSRTGNHERAGEEGGEQSGWMRQARFLHGLKCIAIGDSSTDLEKGIVRLAGMAVVQTMGKNQRSADMRIWNDGMRCALFFLTCSWLLCSTT
jgi:hypothetical protein